MSYACPVCGGSIASWLLNNKRIECPDCQSLLTSNKSRVIKQCFVVALAVWFMVLVGVQQYSGSWGYAVLVSFEVGGILAAMMTMLYYRLAIKLRLDKATTRKKE